ncbi:hypothetical protein PanWU01x14_233580, partial [Parasponia andersonii]
SGTKFFLYLSILHLSNFFFLLRTIFYTSGGKLWLLRNPISLFLEVLVPVFLVAKPMKLKNHIIRYSSRYSMVEKYNPIIQKICMSSCFPNILREMLITNNLHKNMTHL